MQEHDLEDDYPIYYGYLYVVDGKVIQSKIEGKVKDLKRMYKATKVTSCDVGARDLWHLIV